MPSRTPRFTICLLAVAMEVVTAVLPAQTQPAPKITSITPRYLAAEGGTKMEIRGTNFTRTMKITLEKPGPLVPPPIAFEYVNNTLVRAVAPLRKKGLVDAVVRDGAINPPSRLTDAAEYVCVGTPAPQEVEATLVDGIAEMHWVNPIAYRSIRVFRDGVLAGTLKGTDTFFRDPTKVTADRARYSLVGEIEAGSTGMADFVVAQMNCPAPRYNFFAQERGPIDFEVFGAHQPYTPSGGGGQLVDATHGTTQYEPVVIDPTTKRPQLKYRKVLNLHGPNELLTGFTLWEPSEKIQIEVHGAKVLNGPNLSLRAIVQSVTPGIDRSFEVVLPEILVDSEHRWMELTYNTKKPPVPPDADPNDPEPAPVPPLPAGDYHLKLYAVGGTLGQAHYAISSDVSIDQILVPGAGCPPYPLVRVTDTTGKNSNPVIEEIIQDGSSQEFFPLQDEQGNYINTVIATLKAKVFDPDVPEDAITKYKWSIDMGIGIDVKETASDSAMFLFPDYGYYKATLTVVDSRCGRTTRKFVVKVHPPCISPPPGNGPNFTFPSPKPNKLHYVTNLPGHMDSFWTRIPADFRAFVVDPAGCEEDAVTRSVQFALFAESASEPLTLTDGKRAIVQGLILNVKIGGADEGEEELVLDSGQAQDQSGARFWVGPFPDMRLIPNQSAATVRLMARASNSNKYTSQSLNDSNWKPWKPVRVFQGSGDAIPGSERLNVHKKPAFLDLPHAYSAGSYEVDTQTYQFKLDMAGYGVGSVNFPDTPEFEMPAGLGSFPSLKNKVSNVSQTAALTFSQGFWSLDSLKAGTNAVAFNGAVNGTRELLKSGSGGGGAGDGFDAETLSYDYCQREELFHESYSTTLFDSILYSGAIGPVQITVSASVSLGVGLDLDTQTEIHLRGLDPSNPFEAHFWLLPRADVSLSAAVRADIFLGLVSVEGGVDFNVAFQMPFHLGIDGGGIVGPQAGLKIDMDIELWFEACVNLVLVELCAGFSQPVYSGNLITEGNPPSEPGSCSGGGGILEALQAGGGSPPIQLNSPDHQLAVASSPSGSKQVAVGIWEFHSTPHVYYFTRAKFGEWSYPPKLVLLPPVQQAEYSGVQLDPQVVFSNESTVLVAWTQGFANEDPELAGVDPSAPVTPDVFNRVMRRKEIVYTFGTWTNEFIDWAPPVRLTNDQGPDGFRADGRVALTALSTLNTVWAAWVRFETPEMSYAVEPPQVDPNGKPVTKVRMSETSIYARKIVAGVPSGAMVNLTGDNDSIDIEPTIATADDGTIMAAWVHDSLHEDMVTSNVGRNILFTKLTGAAWSAPAPVIADVSWLPGILGPSLALSRKGNHGMLAFTALPMNAAETDTGLQNTRVLYAAKYHQGVWQPPVLIEKKCDTPIYAHWTKVVRDPGPLEEDIPIPDWTIFVNELGPIGTRIGAGNVLAITYDSKKGAWGKPKNLTPDDRLHQGVAAVLTAAGEMVVLDQSPFFALRNAMTGRVAGKLLGTDGVRVQIHGLVADPAISKLSVSDRYAAPGSNLLVTVGIENNGFRDTPANPFLGSLLDVNVYFQKEGQQRYQVADAKVPVISPGDEALVELELTMPREPVKLIVEVDGVSGEMTPEDNVRTTALGTPAPIDLGLTLIERAGRRAVVLRWKNGGLYDRVQVYRDGKMIRELPGEATSLIDAGAGLLHLDGLAPRHEYSVRGLKGESRSQKLSAAIETDVEVGPVRRGDFDGNGEMDISDAIALLGHLFLGGKDPACDDAADADDNGEIEITDGIRILGYLFTGGQAPPAPGPNACGADPTADSLAACEAVCR